MRANGWVIGATVLVLGGCGGGGALGTLGDILGAATGQGGGGQQQQQQQIQAEIQRVDANDQRVYVRTREGRDGSVRFDQNTAVIYQQQQYPVTALERGDLVNLTVRQISQNELYASRFDVVQSVQDRQGRR